MSLFSPVDLGWSESKMEEFLGKSLPPLIMVAQRFLPIYGIEDPHFAMRVLVSTKPGDEHTAKKDERLKALKSTRGKIFQSCWKRVMEQLICKREEEVRTHNMDGRVEVDAFSKKGENEQSLCGLENVCKNYWDGIVVERIRCIQAYGVQTARGLLVACVDLNLPSWALQLAATTIHGGLLAVMEKALEPAPEPA